MSAIYESIGRLMVWAVRTRYQRQLRVVAGAGVVAVAVAGYLIASREPPEG